VTLVVVPAVATDVAAIREVGLATWPATYSFAGDAYIEDGLATWWSTDTLLQSVADTTVLVAVDDGVVVGVGNIDLRGDVPIIWKLYVLPDVQGSGAGSALLAALLGCVPAETESVRLEYAAGNERAAAFYAAKGFTELRREPGEQAGWPDTVWMERLFPLHFIHDSQAS
jgi:GNAT superfamily N-acetyltransferase